MNENKKTETEYDQTQYCLVKYCYWEATGKQLNCKNCIMKCKYRE